MKSRGKFVGWSDTSRRNEAEFRPTNTLLAQSFALQQQPNHGNFCCSGVCTVPMKTAAAWALTGRWTWRTSRPHVNFDGFWVDLQWCMLQNGNLKLQERWPSDICIAAASDCVLKVCKLSSTEIDWKLHVPFVPTGTLFGKFMATFSLGLSAC